MSLMVYIYTIRKMPVQLSEMTQFFHAYTYSYFYLFYLHATAPFSDTTMFYAPPIMELQYSQAHEQFQTSQFMEYV